MASSRNNDGEAAGGLGLDGQLDRYYDDPDQVDEDIGPDAPIQSSHRPPSEFDDLLGELNSSWRDRASKSVPKWITKAWGATVTWVKGPKPPRIYRITPISPKVQHFPLAILDRYAPTKVRRFWLLVSVIVCWLLTFSLILRQSSFSLSIPGYGSPTRLGCQARYWGDKNSCGLNGDLCRPFANLSFAFRCPAECHKTAILNPHAVGDKEVVYKPLVVGGPAKIKTGFEDELLDNAIYRGDSFICASAVHAGFLDDRQGGCGVLKLTGEQSIFESSERNGIPGTSFDSYFPQSFGFLAGSRSQCKDLRWPALAVSVIFSCIISLFTTSPAVFFWSIFVGLFFHIALASDPPNLTDYHSLVSIAFGRFLPACFCGWVTYRYTVRRTLTDLTAQIEKTILWLGPCWVGSLNNYTFDRIPIQRLTPHDIQAQPGAIPALITVVLTIFFIAVGQAWAFRVEGRMPRYLALYSIFVVALLIMVAVPGLNLRIHHYILALLLLPGTSFQNRPSLIYQGLLTGLFLNGIARWGFDSVLQTPRELLVGAPEGTLLPVVSIIAAGVQNITFDLGLLPRYDSKLKTTFDGISILVNDVERFRGYADNRDYWPGERTPGGNFTWTWTRHQVWSDDQVVEKDTAGSNALLKPLPEYFRFGCLAGNRVGDFTKAGKWETDGTWKPMKSGSS